MYFYVSLSFIKEHASCYYKTYQNPKRLVIMSDRSASYTMASLTEDTRVRKGPNKKIQIFCGTGKRHPRICGDGQEKGK